MAAASAIADGVGAACLISLGRNSPYNAVEGDDFHSTPSTHIRVALFEDIFATDQRPSTEWSIHFMCRYADEIQVSWVIKGQHVDFSVWGELGAIYHEQHPLHVFFQPVVIGLMKPVTLLAR
jgi:hypothetical protein